MHGAAGFLILIKEGAAVLIDHNAVLMQSFVAAAVKFFGEQAGRMAERVGAIVDDEIVLVLSAAQKAQAVLIVDAHPYIIKPAGIVREILAADIDKHLVGLDHIDNFNLVIIGKFACNTAVAAANDKHPFDIRVDGHRHMDDHLIIGELIFFRKDHASVGGQKAPEFRRIKDVNTLKIAGGTVELPFHPDTGFDIGGVQFTEPVIHFLHVSPPSAH